MVEYIFPVVLTVFAGLFAYYSSVIVAEEKNFSRKTTRRK